VNPNEHIAPFLSQPVGLKVGLNHLGYRNSAELLFTTLLPGLNNVTARIRYYSFYCWVLDKFFEIYDSPTVRDYYSFVRYSEYLLALLHTNLEDSGGIPGIDYALTVMSENPDVVDLSAGSFNADGSTRGTYWANKGGVLRQYYGNSLRDIGIIVPNLKYPELSNISKEGNNITGKELAECFEHSIGVEASQTFLNCVKNHSSSKEERKAIRDAFIMKNVLFDKDEKSLLSNLLIQEDLPGRSDRCYRKETIRLFLEYYNDTVEYNYKDEFEFPKYLYQRYLQGERSTPCITGWYCYYLDDIWQFNASVVLEGILDILNKDKFCKWVELDQFTSELSEIISERFAAEGRSLEYILADLPEIYGKDNCARICKAIHSVLQHYKTNKGLWPENEVLRKLFGYYSMDDFHSISLFIEKYFNKDFKLFVKYLLESKIIYRHYNVSLRKFYQTGIASHKFMLEGGFIRYLRDTVAIATHTSPRLNSLKNFLSDLGMISQNGLTSYGLEVYSSLS
jgi:hypothetical protein